MCIYYKNQSPLRYESKEHIFPAAIGGKATLPIEYVSSEFNNDISKIEQDFFRKGFVSLLRQFHGPGKRGSLSHKNATKSKVQVLCSDEVVDQFGLAYTCLGNVYHIPHLQINTKTNQVTLNFESTQPIFLPDTNMFLAKLKNYDKSKCRTWIDDTLTDGVVLLGIEEGVEENFNYFLVYNHNNKIVFTHDKIIEIANSLRFNNDFQHSQYQPIINDSVLFTDNHLRVLGKIAFNYLAHLQGADFVKDDIYNSVRNWIAKGVNDKSLQINLKTQSSAFNFLQFPELAHTVFITQMNEKLIAEISLYNAIVINIILCDNFEGNFETQGFICDWQKGSEYSLEQFLVSKTVGYMATNYNTTQNIHE